jgi:hypothetical protein
MHEAGSRSFTFVALLQELLRNAVAVEKKKIIAEQRLKRAVDDKFPTAADAPNEVILKKINSVLLTMTLMHHLIILPVFSPFSFSY